MTEAQPQIPPLPQTVPVQPCPTGYTVMATTGPAGESLVVLIFSTPSGSQAYFMPPEFAAKFIADVEGQLVPARRPKLVVPTLTALNGTMR